MASSITSGPIPSPGTTAIFFAALRSRRQQHQHQQQQQQQQQHHHHQHAHARVKQRTRSEAEAQKARSAAHRCSALLGCPAQHSPAQVTHAAAEYVRCCLTAATPARRALRLAESIICGPHTSSLTTASSSVAVAVQAGRTGGGAAPPIIDLDLVPGTRY